MLVLFTDTDTDMSLELANQMGWNLICMPYTINDKTIYPYIDYYKFNAKEFYDILRGGVVPKTFALNPNNYIEYFEPHLKAGNDILYVHFSKNMSGTFNSLNIAINELKEQYPNNTIYTIDTKGVSVCSLNIIYEIDKLIKNNTSIEEVLKWAKNEVDHFATYFYADNLNFFKASGRVSNMSANLGNIFGIHPIIHMSEEGKLVNIAKVKGKKASLRRLMQYVEELGDNIKDHKVLIAQTDAYDLASILKQNLKEIYGEDLDTEIVEVNPTIGAHCGPDCIGVCFHSKSR